jgi:hypothetical protein
MDGSTLRRAQDKPDGSSANAARPVHQDKVAEFEDGDPRLGPHSLEERAEAAAMMEAPGRWHYRRPDIDWFAVQLQRGRGFKTNEAADMFGIGRPTVDEHRRKGKWPRILSERDRRRLSRLVWLAGIARGLGEDETSRAMLRKTSEWRLLAAHRPPVFELQDKQGAAEAATINSEEFPDDAYYTDADPRREDRIAMRSKLDELVARMERDVLRGQAPGDGALVPEVAHDEGSAGGPASD